MDGLLGVARIDETPQSGFTLCVHRIPLTLYYRPFHGKPIR